PLSSFGVTASTGTYPLSLHDALPISMRKVRRIFWYPASTSPSPGSGPAAVSSSARPPVRPLAPSPSALASSTSTDFFGASLANQDRKSTRLNSSHDQISYAGVCLKKK